MQPIPEIHPLKQLFGGLVEHAFYTELGVCDPALADYVSDLLVSFVHVDNMSLARDAAGRPIGEIAELVSNWESAGGLPGRVPDRAVHRRIGDYALFWTGVYPEMIRRHRATHWHDDLLYYVSFGKRSYAIASELTRPDELPPADLLRRLSQDFEFCAHGLGLVRRDLEHTPPASGETPGIIY